MSWLDVIGIRGAGTYPEGIKRRKTRSDAALSDETAAKIIKEYMKAHKDATRNQLVKKLHISTVRLDKLESMGLIKQPAKVKPGRKYGFAGKNHPWRNGG